MSKKIDELLAVQRIPLSQGKYAIVDAKDYDWLNQWKWSATKVRNTFYATRIQTKPKRKKILMHREILGLKYGDGKLTDHRNLNGLNNRKHNLRICTNSQNHQNSAIRKGTSRYKGVSWNKRANQWQVGIKLQGKNIYIGYHKNEKEAAKLYNKKAKELFGEFARLNNV